MRIAAKRGRSRWRLGLAVLALLLALGAVAVYLKQYAAEMVKKQMEFSAWLVDWQWQEGLSDLPNVDGGLDSLHLFAVYFNAQDKLLVNEAMQDMQMGIQETFQQLEIAAPPRLYMTVVNDIWQEDGTSLQKDTRLVTRLVESEASRQSHIEELLELADAYGLDGIELDYERIGEQDWDRVVLLITELYDQLAERGKSLRVVLEPEAPLEALTLPQGPEYVVLAYNLYGTHSGPGPKADPSFVKKQARRLKQISGDHVLALAAGGFDWQQGGEGKVRSVTEQRAKELVEEHQAAPVRDEESGSLHFNYRDDQGIEHIVWYADQITLSQWMRAAQQQGIHQIALWRLGELGEGTLHYFNDLHDESL